MAEAYLLDGLTIQHLQGNRPGLIQRNARFRGKDGRFRDIDGIIVGQDDTLIVEVRRAGKRRLTAEVLQRAVDQIASDVFMLRDQGYPDPHGAVAILADTANDALKLEATFADKVQTSARVKVVFLAADELKSKYGFTA
jgi:hypothetical protein